VRLWAVVVFLPFVLFFTFESEIHRLPGYVFSRRAVRSGHSLAFMRIIGSGHTQVLGRTLVFRRASTKVRPSTRFF